MNKYTGMTCVSCQEPFTDQDDVVVCPTCGAPHHRNCYMAEKRCALAAQHAPDFAWQPDPDALSAPAGELRLQVCTHCNTTNPAEAEACRFCGRPLAAAPAGSDTGDAQPRQQDAASRGSYQPHGAAGQTNNSWSPFVAVDDTWQVEGVSARELAAYTGNSSYYFITQFRRLLSNRFQLSWNWGALFFNFFYFFYRRMYKMGLVLLGFYFVSILPNILCYIGPTDASMEVMGVVIRYNSQMAADTAMISQILSTLRWFVSILCAMFANKLFLRTALNDISRFRTALNNSLDEKSYYTALYFRGRPNSLAVMLLVFGIFTGYSIFIRMTGILP